MNVIPAIDLLDGNVVRLQKGDYEKVTVYSEDPVAVARDFADAGFSHIHVVDLDGARSGNFSNLSLVLRIKEELGLSVQMGGGIRNFEHVTHLFESGVAKIVCSSMAVKNEAHWLKALEIYGGDRCILGMDLKDGKMAYAGWIETMDEPVHEYLMRMEARGLKEILCTDISRDGMLSGANVELYQHLMSGFPELNFIASGGVAGVEDLKRLSEIQVHAVVVGRAYLEGQLTLQQMKAYNAIN